LKPNWIALLCVAGCVLALLWLASTGAGTGPIAAASAALVLAAALAWWQSLRPSNKRDWQPVYARAPAALIGGDRVTLSNVRNFRYRSESDFDEIWEERKYDLAKLEGLDIFFSHWSSPLYAHTIMSWPFSDGQYLAISVETRRRRTQQYSAIKGFFRQYELMYVAGDERDLIGVRAGIRSQDVYLYRLRVSAVAARNLLLEYFAEMNAVAARPRWYNALVANCTTTIHQRVIQAGGKLPLTWRLFANGYLPEFLYRRGFLDTSRPFGELKALSRIGDRARAALDREDFSAVIRAGLPIPRVSG
jgi:hypothetical protein